MDTGGEALHVVSVFVCTCVCVWCPCIVPVSFDLSLAGESSGLSDTHVLVQCLPLRNFPGKHKACLCKRTIILNDSAY